MPALTGWIDAQRVTHMLCVPTLYQVILEHLVDATAAALQTVIVAAEAPSLALVQQHRDVLGDALLVNEYGPTETTVWATAGHLAQSNGSRITIGKPIDGTQVYVLDDNAQLLPAGWPSEIYIGGAGVAQGYLGQPEETLARFINDPFSADGKLYKTGDLGVFHPDGQLQWLGRVDNQIKIRGFRVEPEEIERTLRSHPAVLDAAVVLHDGQPEPDVKALTLALSQSDGARKILEEIEAMSDDAILAALAGKSR